ncbi:Starch-binding associating with outer membrane [Pustulibacterium marinum]|uniref:Starch-binding associating with outer membrane n=1 Tax=Pustulibacterium marinum TaxID=1224947 RepID=A0A1I7FMI1_9FLAO|nr:SusD/RagB family nutrient-binding outer membrane lipoprotein [Pustulibacterium marinum]SFU37338.1 Starch-binding associating with outer membrane [Pustulibacterium marinum]
MKKTYILKFLAVLAISSFTLSCDKDYESMNVDPTSSDELDIIYEFPTAVLYTSGQRYETWRGNLIYSSTMVQHLSSLETYWSGDKYLWNSSYASAYWDAQYPQTIKTIEDMKYNIEANGDITNSNYAITRILRVLAYSRITDLYGDIPYSEAGKGYIDGNTRPAYDAQEDIYADMLNELSESAAMLTDGETADLGTADIIFSGDEGKWKRFANSLMLRLALRMVKVDESSAQQWAATAINGGVMESNDDIAYVQHEEGNGIVQNANGETFQADNTPRLSETFVNFMKDHNDPRLTIYGALPDGTDDYDVQQGLPNGYDTSTITNYDADFDLANYTAPSDLVNGRDVPMFFQTYAEVEFMLAESAYRWSLGTGTAESHYNAGVEAAMTYLSLYSSEATISSSEVSEYLEAYPYDASSALEMINTQYWAATFLNEYEAYANWRRTGYPELTPVNYSGNVTNGTIPRRLTYPTNEQTTNGTSYAAAVSSQGPDALTTRMWWDVE